MEDREFVIYKFTSPSGKSYIGQTNDLKRRTNQHRTRESCRAFAAAIRRYGWSSFEIEILASGLTQDQANQLERDCIKQHGTLSPGGYNLRTGGDNSRPSVETIDRMRAVQSTKSPEWRQKISDTLRGRPLPACVRDKVADANRGGRRSDETKAKMAEARRLYWVRRRSEAEATGTTVSSPLKGVPKSESTKKKLSDSQTRFQAGKREAAQRRLQTELESVYADTVAENGTAKILTRQ